MRLLEDNRIELKREIPTPKKLAVEVIALANGGGGRIGIGYDEKQQQVVGIDLSQQYEERIANIIFDYCSPRVEYSISYESCGEQQMLWINIHKSSSVPFYLKKQGMVDGAYIRVGSTTRHADQESLARLIREGKNISFDSLTISQPISLSRQRLQQYLLKRKQRLNSPVPKITHTLHTDLSLQKNDTLTVAGCLLFCDQPQNVPELHQAYIKAARFKGTSKGLFLDQQEITGPLPDQIDHAVHFILKNIALRGIIKGNQRIDEYEYPPEILRELVVNAVIHRDYSIGGSCILLAIYDDRITITSPGSLPLPVTVDNIINRQYNRNPIIAKRMFEMGYFDAWGQGIDQLTRWAETQSSKPIEFDDSPQQFSVTLYAAKTTIEPRTIIHTLDQQILTYLKTHPQINNKTIQQKFSATKSQAQSKKVNFLA